MSQPVEVVDLSFGPMMLDDLYLKAVFTQWWATFGRGRSSEPRPMIPCVSGTSGTSSGTSSAPSAEHHYAHAAERHYKDAVYLQDGGRLPNADYHLGFAVECALKSLLLRFTAATMAPKKQGKPPANAPWVSDPVTGKVSHDYGHLPWVTADVSLLTHGRSAARLSAALANLTAFDSWSVHQRYLDGTAVAETDVSRRRTVAQEILGLHEQALITGRLQ